jgi:hypothetical protein
MREFTVSILESYERNQVIRIKAGNEKMLQERIVDMVEAQRRRLGMDHGEVVAVEILQ